MNATADVVRAEDLASDRFAVARAALAEVPLPVVVLGAADGEARSCATGTAMYVSFAPARLAVAIHPGSTTCRLVEATGRFSISVLRADQVAVAVAAGHGASGTDKFATLGLATRETDLLPGVPALADASSIAWCRVTDRLPTGDHVLFVGEVVAFAPPVTAAEAGGLEDVPLLRHQRRYAALGSWLSDTGLDGYPT
ncbi:MAG: flavin reductase [Chloroflexi bacterium]|nr:flavin reductase [Chloroflexota bacterium]